MLKTVLWGALLVATSLLNTYKVLSKSDKNWPSYEQNTICPYLVIRNKYFRFWPINWANINQGAGKRPAAQETQIVRASPEGRCPRPEGPRAAEH